MYRGAFLVKEPCGNEDCDVCYPIPRWTVRTKRLQWVTHQRMVKATSKEEALRIVEEGTAWLSSYDDRPGEIVEQHDPVVTPAEDKAYDCCYHNLGSTT